MSSPHAPGGGAITHPLAGDAVRAPLGPGRSALTSTCAPEPCRLGSETPPFGVGDRPAAAFRLVIL